MLISELSVEYNDFVDILNISIRGKIVRTGVELSPKIIWKFQINHVPAGITIMDFKELEPEKLYNVVEEFLKHSDIANYQLLNLIDKAVG